MQNPNPSSLPVCGFAFCLWCCIHKWNGSGGGVRRYREQTLPQQPQKSHGSAAPLGQIGGRVDSLIWIPLDLHWIFSLFSKFGNISIDLQANRIDSYKSNFNLFLFGIISSDTLWSSIKIALIPLNLLNIYPNLWFCFKLI